ncbi:hypothetical protein CICLE_v10010099mg [Citrus x clementina]|uniref:Uncharacterized protein n=1 Tax=Citrus clementina TaxID=85681 RepID=V4UHI0_CITCL|nr:hypothetical protein CICLE_v10010099mg [Citrus x clementina]
MELIFLCLGVGRPLIVCEERIFRLRPKTTAKDKKSRVGCLLIVREERIFRLCPTTAGKDKKKNPDKCLIVCQ